MEKDKSNKKKSFDKNEEKSKDENRRKNHSSIDILSGHLPRPCCKKMLSVWRSMIRKRHTTFKEAFIPLDGRGSEFENVRSSFKNKQGELIVTPPVNQIWREMMGGPRPKKRAKNIRMPEPKITGKRR